MTVSWFCSSGTFDRKWHFVTLEYCTVLTETTYRFSQSKSMEWILSFSIISICFCFWGINKRSPIHPSWLILSPKLLTSVPFQVFGASPWNARKPYLFVRRRKRQSRYNISLNIDTWNPAFITPRFIKIWLSKRLVDSRQVWQRILLYVPFQVTARELTLWKLLSYDTYMHILNMRSTI